MSIKRRVLKVHVIVWGIVCQSPLQAKMFQRICLREYFREACGSRSLPPISPRRERQHLQVRRIPRNNIFARKRGSNLHFKMCSLVKTPDLKASDNRFPVYDSCRQLPHRSKFPMTLSLVKCFHRCGVKYSNMIPVTSQKIVSQSKYTPPW